MQKRLFIGFIFTFLGVSGSFAQVDWLNNKVFKSPGRKHQIWLMWGYNRAGYTKSDIHFSGAGYDFTLHDVVAKDRQSPFAADVYLNPKNMTIPQYIVRGGFFITDRMAVTFGHDHMKYVAVTDQQLTMSGTIDTSVSTTYAGTYDNTPITFSRDFIRFEHTNGLNYVSAELQYYGLLWKSWGKKQELNFYTSLGLGALYPRSDVDMFDVEGVNVFHVAGWGTSLEGGIRFDVLPQLFFTLSVKGGFIAMPDIITITSSHIAKQHFWFLQRTMSLGLSLNSLNRRQSIKDPKGLKTLKS